jgi:hypothetical protein
MSLTQSPKLIRVISSVLLILFCYLTGTQNMAGQNEDPYGIHPVKEALLEQSEGITDSSTEKYIYRLGDKVSVALLKILKEEELSDPKKIRQILPIIEKAFSGLQFVSVADDRKPKVTVFFLTHLQANIKDPVLKKDIFQLLEFIKQKTASANSK